MVFTNFTDVEKVALPLMCHSTMSKLERVLGTPSKKWIEFGAGTTVHMEWVRRLAGRELLMVIGGRGDVRLFEKYYYSTTKKERCRDGQGNIDKMTLCSPQGCEELTKLNEWLNEDDRGLTVD